MKTGPLRKLACYAIAACMLLSAWSTKTAHADTITPPTSLTATTVSQTQVNLSWQWNDPGMTSQGYFYIYVNGSYWSTRSLSMGTSSYSYSVTGLSCGTSYTFQVFTYDQDMDLESTTASVTKSTSSCVSVPNAASLSASPVSSTQIDLSWTLSPDNATEFRVFRSLVNGAPWTYLGTVGGSTHSYSSTGLSPGTTYWYYVTSVNSAGARDSNNTSARTFSAPVNPSNVTATQSLASSVNVTWSDNSNNETGFYVYVDGIREGQLGAGQTAWTDTGLSCSESHSYTVRAVNDYGESSGSNSTATGRTATCSGPNAPSNLTVSPNYSTPSFTLQWTDNSNNETGFTIYQDGKTFGYSSVTSATWTGNYANMECGSYHTYTVSAYNTYGESTQSNAVTVQTAPCAVTNLSGYPGSCGTDAINLSWSATTGAEEYDIYRDGGYIMSVPSTSFSESSFGPNSTHSYYVRATNSMGQASGNSNTVTVTSPNICTPPSPSGLNSSSPSSSQINLYWTDNSSNESGFYIYYSNGTYIGAVGANATSYSVTGLSANTTYSFYVKSYNAGGSSGASNTATATTLKAPPGAFTLTLSNGACASGTVNLSWGAASGAEGYKVYRDGNSTPLTTTTGTSYADTGAGTNASHSYQIQAYNNGGSTYSNTPSITSPNICTPSAPSNLSATAPSQTQINLSWTDNSSNESGFYIYYSNGTYIGAVGANATSYSVTGLSAGTTYSFYVVAYNAGGSSGASNTASAITYPGNFTLTATPSSCGTNTVNLSWTSPAGSSSFRPFRDGSAISGTGSLSYSDGTAGANTSHTYKIEASNASGVTFSNSVTVTSPQLCDTTPPTISYSPTSRTWGGAISVTVTAADPSGVASTQYCWTTSASCTPTTAFSNGSALAQSSTGAWNLCVKATDSSPAANSATSCSGTYNVDVTNPTPDPATITTQSVGQTWATLAVGAGSDPNAGLHATPYGISPQGGMYTYYAANSQTINGLACGTTYTYYGVVRDALGNQTNPGSTTFTTQACTPAAPSNLTANVISQTQINLTWTDNSSNETGFYIYQNGSFFTSVAANTTSYSATGLSSCTGYTYQVIAYNSGGNVGSNTVTPTTGCTAPTPTNVSTTVTGQTTATVTWTDNSSIENGFKVYSNGGVLKATVGANVTTASITGLTCGTYYHFYVVATAAAPNADSPSSAISNAITTSACTPGAPSSLTATPSSCGTQTINLSWADNSANEDGFRVYRDGGLIATLSVGSTSYSDTGAGTNTAHTYYVQAYNAGGTANSNTTSSVTSPQVCAPNGTPGGSAATALSSTSIKLTWTDNSSNEDGFYVYRNGSYLTSVAANATSYTDSGLAVCTSYSYYVVAYNAGGNSPASNTATAKTLGCVQIPTNISPTAVAEPGNPYIKSTWSSTGANGYVVITKDSKTGLQKVPVDTSSAGARTLVSCPADYTLYYFSYNNDPDVGSSTDPSCSELSSYSAALATGKKCTGSVTRDVKVRYCTHGFLGD